MRISELGRDSGVAVATIKYYLREGLLHEGRRTSATQAQYDESHVARLRLVRALIGVGGLSVAAARDVLEQLDNPPETMHDLLGTAHRSLGPAVDEEVDTAAAEAVLERLGWRVQSADRQAVRQLAAALDALEAADFPLSEEAVTTYARAMRELAEGEVSGVPVESREAAVRYLVLGTVLVEPLLLALRRLAQADASLRHHGS
ncbi:MerR HTH family regulatory protein [Saccharopolyspora kobensis]|uniref:MerR HTH family regulatory protein n=1 Tax=Saccharopolyspora kobensis TaxID=146035 RepID=A0A1H6E8G1_9PSEU|nr:MerR family transcriptional regulator [Saccharopolyspora kobensis]SEG93429.1 MerR HTH family regulatory protein [Saccharopolyspora kobensis]SFD45164.1 MerR HTH family regulatory protein [Saccharopolyspora kobensis]